MHAGGLDLAGPVGARDVAPPVLPSRRLDRVGILIPNRTGACRASGSRRATTKDDNESRVPSFAFNEMGPYFRRSR